MISVGVKELKEKLSKYVDKVKHGERVIITDRGNEVALITPLSEEYHKIKSLIDSGKAVWSGGKPEGVKGIKIKGKPVAETVLEERR
ncbi:MAG: type II toxin-antitoxin system prevent-host-death family antitoxin [Deltaproteobacteria bacterium]|nr:type II toxin-antitoxin system prevent-host-death family antitoxin [Deltaproteobacteria bacterium]